MKKLAMLLAIVLLASNIVGCGCFRRITNRFNRGAFCGPVTTAIAGPAAPVAPQPQVIMPAPAPVIVPQASCDPCCPPCVPCCDPCCDPCGGFGAYTPTSYPVDGGFGGYGGYGGADCGCCTGTTGTVPSTVVDPAPAGQ